MSQPGRIGGPAQTREQEETLTVQAAGFPGCSLRSTIAQPSLATRRRCDTRPHASGESRFALAGCTAQTDAQTPAPT